MKPRFLLSFLLLLSLGAGCRHSPPTPAPEVSSPPSATTTSLPRVYLPPKTEIDPKEQALRELRTVIQDFQGVKSFRATVTIDNTTTHEKMTGNIEVVKPDRFRGTFQVGGDVPVQKIIGVQDSLYLQLPDATWKKIVSPTLTEALKGAFQSTIKDGQTLLDAQFTSSSRITKTVNASAGCTTYQTTVQEKSGTRTDVTICAANGLPKTMTLASEQGSVSITYLDYNALFTIERPTVVE